MSSSAMATNLVNTTPRAKIRGFVVDKSTGTPLQGVVVLDVAQPDENVQFPLGMLVSDSAGYVLFDLGPVAATRLKRLWVEASGDGNNRAEVTATQAPYFFILKVDTKLALPDHRVTSILPEAGSHRLGALPLFVF